MVTKRTQIQTKRNAEESQVITEVSLKAGELFYNTPTEDIFVGNGKDTISELTPLNVAGLTASHSADKQNGSHIFKINSNIGKAKVFSFISYITQDYQNGDAIYLIFEGFSSLATDNENLKPFKILTMHRLPPEAKAFKTGDMAMFFVHINDDYEVDSEGFLGQIFLYYLDNEGNLSLNYNYNAGNLNPSHPITKLFPEVTPATQMCDQGETVTVFPIKPSSREYEFTGWYENTAGLGDAHQPGSDIVVNNNMTLYASWKLKSFTTLIYNANTSAYDFLGQLLSRPNDANFYKPEEIPVITSTVPTAEGGTFSGTWTMNNSNFYKGDAIITDKESLTFYAVWNRHTNYTIKYMDGTKEVANQSRVGSKQTIELYSDVGTRKTEVFEGWYADSSCKIRVGNAGDSWTVPPQSDPNAIIKLYAKWTAKDRYSVKISSTYQDNSKLTLNGESKEFGTYPFYKDDKITVEVTPINNYKFSSWTVTGSSYSSTGNKLDCTVTKNTTIRAIIEEPDPVPVNCTVKTKSYIDSIILSPESHLFKYNSAEDKCEYSIVGEDDIPVVIANGKIQTFIKYDSDGIAIASLFSGYDKIATVDYDPNITIDPPGLGEWLVKVPYGASGMIATESDLESAEYFDIVALKNYSGKKTIYMMSPDREETEKEFVLLPEDCAIDNFTGGVLKYEDRILDEEGDIVITNKNSKLILSNVSKTGELNPGLVLNPTNIPVGKQVRSTIKINDSSPSDFRIDPSNTTYNETPIKYKISTDSNYSAFIVNGTIKHKLAYDFSDNTLIASVNTGYKFIKQIGKNDTVNYGNNKDISWLVKVPFDDHDIMIDDESGLSHTEYYKLVPLSSLDTYGKKSIVINNVDTINKTFIPQNYSVSNTTQGVLTYNGNIITDNINLNDSTINTINLNNCQSSGVVALSHLENTPQRIICVNNTNLDILHITPEFSDFTMGIPSKKSIFSVNPTHSASQQRWQIISKKDSRVTYYFTYQDPSPISIATINGNWCTPGYGSDRYITINENITGTYSFVLHTGNGSFMTVFVDIYPEYTMLASYNGKGSWQSEFAGHIESRQVDDEINGWQYLRYELKDFPRQCTCTVTDTTKNATFSIKNSLNKEI